MQSTETVPPTEDVREALAGAVNDNHGCTRMWADLRSRTGLARTNGDDYAIRIAYQAADAILADPQFEVRLANSTGAGGVMQPSESEQREAIEAVRGWLNGPSGPGFRVLRVLLWMAEKSRDGRLE